MQFVQSNANVRQMLRSKFETLVEIKGRGREPQLVTLSTVNTAIIGKDIRRSVIYRSGVNPDWQPQLSN